MSKAIRRPFTPAEDAQIIARYSTTYLSTIAANLGRGIESVRERSRVLVRRGRLRRDDRFYQRPWTPEEDEMLSDLWGNYPDATVARRLGRSVDACKVRSTRAGYCRKQAFYCQKDMARIFGVDDHLVARWREEGFLHGQPSAVRASTRRMWRYDEAAIKQFVTRYPWRYDHRRIEIRSYWRNLADRVWQADPLLTIPQAARFTGLAEETIRRYLRGGRVAGKKRPVSGGGMWLIARSRLGALGLVKRVAA